MKKINYICDRCGKLIEGDIYEIAPECVSREDGVTLLGVPDEISDKLYAMLEDKHLCFNCVKEVIRQAFLPLLIPEAQAASPEERVACDKKHEKNTEIVQVLKKYAASGMTIREAESKTGISYSKIYHMATKYGIMFKKADSKQDVKQDNPEAEVNEECKKPNDKLSLNYDDIVELYCNQDKNMHTIANELGTTVESVRNFIMKNKIFKNKTLQEKYENEHLCEN